MTVYIEQVILDNFAVNLLIVLSCVKLLKRQTIKWRVAVSAFVGTAFAVFYPFIDKFIFGYKLFCAILMVFIYLPYNTVKQFFLSLLIFFGLSFLFGGVVGGILNFNTDFSGAFLVSNGGLLGATVLSAIFFAYFLKEVKHFLTKRTKLDSGSLKATFELDKTSYAVIALMDSGNTLYDHLTGSCVSVLSADIAKLHLKGSERKIEVSTINGISSLPLLEIYNLKIRNTVIKKALVAVTDKPLNDHKLILHTDLIQETDESVKVYESKQSLEATKGEL